MLCLFYYFLTNSYKLICNIFQKMFLFKFHDWPLFSVMIFFIRNRKSFLLLRRITMLTSFYRKFIAISLALTLVFVTLPITYATSIEDVPNASRSSTDNTTSCVLFDMDQVYSNNYVQSSINSLCLCLSIRNCIKRAPKSTVPGQHRFGFEKPRFCSL